MRVALLVLAFATVCDGIIPEIVYPGVSHILEDNPAQGQTELGRSFVEVQQLGPEGPAQKPEDASRPKDEETASLHPNNLPPGHRNETAPDKVIDNHSDHTPVDQETNNISTTTDQYSDLGNNIDHGCVTDEVCGKGRYCGNAVHNSKCMPCKAIDVSCTKDVECCNEQLCVWGQCSANATKGEAGSTCQHQTDCSTDLCCALHKALLFAVCSAKPIERERCFGASNHLTEMMSWDVQDKGPRKHCPCAGDLHCQHLGRGSMCLPGDDSSEEDLTDTLYSEIDYII